MMTPAYAGQDAERDFRELEDGFARGHYVMTAHSQFGPTPQARPLTTATTGLLMASMYTSNRDESREYCAEASTIAQHLGKRPMSAPARRARSVSGYHEALDRIIGLVLFEYRQDLVGDLACR